MYLVRVSDSKEARHSEMHAVPKRSGVLNSATADFFCQAALPKNE